MTNKDKIIIGTIITSDSKIHHDVKIREVKSGYGFEGNTVLVKATDIIQADDSISNDLYFAMTFHRCVKGSGCVVTNVGTTSHEKIIPKMYYFA